MHKGDVRRAQILKVAEELFYAKGYEKTTVNMILDRLHLSKGGFYHHFTSKEQLLEAICENKAVQSYQAAEAAVAACPGGASDRFNAMFDQYGLWKDDNVDFLGLLIRVAYRDDNLIMREKLKRKTMELTYPLLRRIVQEGVDAGEFITPYPEGVSTLVLQLGASLSDAIASLLLVKSGPPDTAKILELLELYRYAVEQVLGAPYGSIVLYQMRHIVGVCMSIYEKHMRGQGAGRKRT